MHQQHEINLAEEGNEEEEVERGESSPEDEEFDRYVGALEEVQYLPTFISGSALFILLLGSNGGGLPLAAGLVSGAAL